MFGNGSNSQDEYSVRRRRRAGAIVLLIIILLAIVIIRDLVPRRNAAGLVRWSMIPGLEVIASFGFLRAHGGDYMVDFEFPSRIAPADVRILHSDGALLHLATKDPQGKQWWAQMAVPDSPTSGTLQVAGGPKLVWELDHATTHGAKWVVITYVDHLPSGPYVYAKAASSRL